MAISIWNMCKTEENQECSQEYWRLRSLEIRHKKYDGPPQ